MLATLLTLTPFTPSLELPESYSLICSTELKGWGLRRATEGTSLLVQEAASLAMGELCFFYFHLLPFFLPASHAPGDFTPCILHVTGNSQRLTLLACSQGFMAFPCPPLQEAWGTPRPP